MRRLAHTRWLSLVAVMVVSTSVADRAIQPDGSWMAVEDAMLVNLGDTTWPGWIALQRSLVVRADDEAASMLGLDDGQVVGGGFNVVAESLWWRSRAFGAMQVDLEHVAWIGPPTIASQPAPARDLIALVNGDRVQGFINALHPDRGIEIESGTGTGTPTRTWYELAKVASIQLSPRPRAATGWRFWLRDGSVVDVDAWKREGSRMLLQGLHLPGVASRVFIAWDEVLGIQRNGQAVLSLASLEWKATDSADTARLAPAQIRIDPSVTAFAIRSVDLHGPGSFTTKVPPGTWTLDLTLAAPPALAGRVGCTVQVLAGDRELARTRLEAGSKPVPVHATVEGGDLRVVISDSAHGALGAAVRLDGAMFVPVTPDAGASTPAPTSAPAGAAGSPGPG